MFIYYFARPNAMVGHNFTDDVAICMAWSKKSAIKKFSDPYADVKESEVEKIQWFKKPRIKILTDY